MKILRVKKRELKLEDYIKRSALPSDYSTLITEPTTLVDDETGEVLFAYFEEDWDTSDIVEVLKRTKYSVGKRARGLLSRSRIFGYRPRLALRADFCSSTSLATEDPKGHAVVCSYAEKIEQKYLQGDPSVYTKHKAIVNEKVKANYRINGTVFTSGIINKNNPLKYHFDTGNFNNVFSCMLVFKSGVTGGHLSLPEYDLGVELKNNSLFMFDGQGILHGVTPIKYASPLSYRYSVVYYSLKNIWQCLEVTEELARVRKKKTEREKIRHNMPKEHREYLKSRYGKQ